MKKFVCLAALMLAGCSKPLTQQEVSQVQKACADIGLVSTVDRGGASGNIVTAVTCRATDSK